MNQKTCKGEVKLYIDLRGGTLSADDTIIDKPYSDPSLTELIGYFWSGKHHRIVKGIQLITLYYTDPSGKSVPANYRIYNKQEGKTKNVYLREMITEVLGWGLQPKIVTGDTWYSSRGNLKFLKDKELGVLMGIAKNRQVSIPGGEFTQVQNREIPEQGLVVHLKKFGQVKVFRRTFKNEVDTTSCTSLIPMLLWQLPEKNLRNSIQSTGGLSATTEPLSNCVALSDLW